ncbi:MAG TPA: 3-dehydroquinate synthase [Candidatus Kryptonia bacterium]
MSVLSYRANASRVQIHITDSNSILQSEIRGAPKPAVVVDSRVAELYRELLVDIESTGEAVVKLFDSKEENKTLAKAEELLDFFLQQNIRRDSVLFAIGGGIVGDLAGFVAAIFQRGIEYVHVPTTLLAMVDSSVGGKVGVNNSFGKNMVGAFHQPRSILMNTRFLDTLPKEELVCGLGEVVKYGVLRGEAFFDFLETNHARLLNRDKRTLQRTIKMSVETKKRYIERDVRETGIRAHLNLGHTIGHALESATGYGTFKHGEAVLIGLVAESHVAMHMKLLRPSGFERILTMVRQIAQHKSARVSIDAVIKKLIFDKKVRSGKVRFVLPAAIGKVVIRDDVPTEAVSDSLRFVAADGFLSIA